MLYKRIHYFFKEKDYLFNNYITHNNLVVSWDDKIKKIYFSYFNQGGVLFLEKNIKNITDISFLRVYTIIENNIIILDMNNFIIITEIKSNKISLYIELENDRNIDIRKIYKIDNKIFILNDWSIFIYKKENEIDTDYKEYINFEFNENILRILNFEEYMFELKNTKKLLDLIKKFYFDKNEKIFYTFNTDLKNILVIKCTNNIYFLNINKLQIIKDNLIYYQTNNLFRITNFNIIKEFIMIQLEDNSYYLLNQLNTLFIKIDNFLNLDKLSDINNYKTFVIFKFQDLDNQNYLLFNKNDNIIYDITQIIKNMELYNLDINYNNFNSIYINDSFKNSVVMDYINTLPINEFKIMNFSTDIKIEEVTKNNIIVTLKYNKVFIINKNYLDSNNNINLKNKLYFIENTYQTCITYDINIILNVNNLTFFKIDDNSKFKKVVKLLNRVLILTEKNVYYIYSIIENKLTLVDGSNNIINVNYNNLNFIVFQYKNNKLNIYNNKLGRFFKLAGFGTNFEIYTYKLVIDKYILIESTIKIFKFYNLKNYKEVNYGKFIFKDFKINKTIISFKLDNDKQIFFNLKNNRFLNIIFDNFANTIIHDYWKYYIIRRLSDRYIYDKVSGNFYNDITIFKIGDYCTFFKIRNNMNCIFKYYNCYVTKISYY